MSTDLANDNFDAFTMDDVDADRPGAGGGRLPEGAYRFVITEVIVKNERGSTQVECEVVAAKDDNLIGRKHVEYLNWPDGEHSVDYNRIKKEQLLAWCYAAKTSSPEIVRQRQATRQGFDPTWLSRMLGQPVLGFMKHSTFTDKSGNEKTTAKLEGRVWAIDDPKGQGIPGWAGANPTPPVTAATSASLVQGQQLPTPPHQETGDPFAGII